MGTSVALAFITGYVPGTARFGAVEGSSWASYDLSDNSGGDEHKGKGSLPPQRRRRLARGNRRYSNKGHSRLHHGYFNSNQDYSRGEPLVMPIRIVSVSDRSTKSIELNQIKSNRLNNPSQRYGKETTGLVNKDTKRMEQIM